MSLLSSDENGSAYITAATIDSLVQKNVRANNRVKECNSVVRIQEYGGVDLDIKLTVLSDTNIPELCSKMRTELKEYVETYTGITVNQITIVVINTYQTAATRVG